MSFHSIVITRRKELNLSQGDLAISLGYTPQAISKFEKTGSSWPVSILPSLSDVLQMSIDELFGLEGEDKKYPNVDQALIGDNLRYLREQKGYRVKEAAKLLDISDRSLEFYEKGTSLINTSTLELIIQVYGIKPTELLYNELRPKLETNKSAKKKTLLVSLTAALATLIVTASVSIPLALHFARGNDNQTGTSENMGSSISTPSGSQEETQTSGDGSSSSSGGSTSSSEDSSSQESSSSSSSSDTSSSSETSSSDEEIDPVNFPGLASVTLPYNGEIEFSATRGATFKLYISFKSVKEKTFVFSTEEYYLCIGTNFGSESYTSSLICDNPNYSFTVPSNFPIGSTMTITPYLYRKLPGEMFPHYVRTKILVIG